MDKHHKIISELPLRSCIACEPFRASERWTRHLHYTLPPHMLDMATFVLSNPKTKEGEDEDDHIYTDCGFTLLGGSWPMGPPEESYNPSRGYMIMLIDAQSDLLDSAFTPLPPPRPRIAKVPNRSMSQSNWDLITKSALSALWVKCASR